MTFPLHTDTFLPYMRDVARCERSLQDLGAAWRLIEGAQAWWLGLLTAHPAEEDA